MARLKDSLIGALLGIILAFAGIAGTALFGGFFIGGGATMELLGHPILSLTITIAFTICGAIIGFIVGAD